MVIMLPEFQIDSLTDSTQLQRVLTTKTQGHEGDFE